MQTTDMELRGRVIEERKNYYIIQATDGKTYHSILKGAARRGQKRLTVGDWAWISPFSDSDGEKALIRRVEKRINELPRPAVANIDQVLLTNCFIEPRCDTVYIDRFLFAASIASIKVHLLFNKVDLLNDEGLTALNNYLAPYRDAGYSITYTSARSDNDFKKVIDLCRGKLTVFAGPSGVGKSSLMSRLFPSHDFVTAPLSSYIERGRNTTTHTTLLSLDSESFVVDTPGFSYMRIPRVAAEECSKHFPDIDRLSGGCKFRNCSHRMEPSCAVRTAYEEGALSADRYENYCDLYELLLEAAKDPLRRDIPYF